MLRHFTRELSGKEFNSNDLRGPKSVSSFISKLSELVPRLVIKQMTMLAKFLDSEVGRHFINTGCNELTRHSRILYAAQSLTSVAI